MEKLEEQQKQQGEGNTQQNSKRIAASSNLTPRAGTTPSCGRQRLRLFNLSKIFACLSYTAMHSRG
jgi:hypothetical protein